MKLILLLLICSSCRACDVASWYATDAPGFVCASYDYPIGALLKVTEARNGCWVIVRVIERGPNHRLNRQIDLCPAAFMVLDGLDLGLAPVVIERIK